MVAPFIYGAKGRVYLNKINVAVLFGGVSSEHEISLLSVANILNSIPKTKYNIYPVGITKKGAWLYCPDAQNGLHPTDWVNLPTNKKAFISPDATVKGLVCEDKIIPIDVVFPVLHGKGGEDGTVQGLLEMAQIPYVGCGVLSSSVCMDKIIANHIFDACGVARCEWDFMLKSELDNLEAIIERVTEKLKYPIFVKPANAGSSVGVSKACNKQQLIDAITLAFKHDTRVIFERAVVGREIECALMGNTVLTASMPGEILASSDFYDYDDKYINGTSSTQIPANLTEKQLTEMREIAKYAYKCLACEGLSRVDFFVENGTNRILINEINTLPGFTAISMYPKMMQAQGLTYEEIADRLIMLAFEKQEEHNG